MTFSDLRSQIHLPLEVLGAEETIKKFSFSLPNRGQASWILLKCNNLSYDGKASYNLNGTGWVKLKDDHVMGNGAVYGGIGGGFGTIDLKIPVDVSNLAFGNKIEFRFNVSDGISIGYRVLKFNVVNNQGKLMLPADKFVYTYPNQDAKGQSPRPNSVAAGKVLWESTNLWNSYKSHGRKIRAKCASCHTAYGRDLKYFNYSDKSIIERSKFHRLTENEGRQIASYIRSLNVPAPSHARPWNPPYQPGPGLDDLRVEQWAAGAGLHAVLKKDEDMLPYLFPNGTSQSEIEKVIGIKKTLNLRKIPIALQFPDWRHLLPQVHPIDIWGTEFTDSPAYKHFIILRTALQTEGWDALIAKRKLLRLMDNFGHKAHNFVGINGAQPCRNSGTANSIGGSTGNSNYDCEKKSRSVMYWLVLKLWDLNQTYKLENRSKDVYAYGEERSWLGSLGSVFDLAPHRIANNSFNFKNQDRLEGAYENTSWYQLELTLNPVHRSPKNHRPIDWKYQMDHLFANTRESGEMHSLRYLTTIAKMWQNLDMAGPDGLGEDKGPKKEGWWLYHSDSRRLYIVHAYFYFMMKILDGRSYQI